LGLGLLERSIAMELREFECKHCGHMVVVNPKFPPDLPREKWPNICTPCWEVFEKPRHNKAMMEIFTGLDKLFNRLGVK